MAEIAGEKWFSHYHSCAGVGNSGNHCPASDQTTFTLNPQPQAIDVNKSSLKIRVFKSGAFSALAHDHKMQAPIAALH
jgi:hypothetical protein